MVNFGDMRFFSSKVINFATRVEDNKARAGLRVIPQVLKIGQESSYAQMSSNSKYSNLYLDQAIKVVVHK